MKEITITMSFEEWEEIVIEAEGHLAYWAEDNEAVSKLRDIIEKNR